MPSFLPLFLLFIDVPVLEIYLLIKVGGQIGAGWTIFVVIATAVIGAGLFRRQGLAAVMRVRNSLDAGEVPAIELLEGVILLVGGALLLTPGFFTDAIGFLCLVPAVRRSLVQRILRHAVVVTASGTTVHEHRDGSRTIEGEYKRED